MSTRSRTRTLAVYEPGDLVFVRSDNGCAMYSEPMYGNYTCRIREGAIMIVQNVSVLAGHLHDDWDREWLLVISGTNVGYVHDDSLNEQCNLFKA